VLVDGGTRVKEMLPIDAALLLYDFPELVKPSVEYQLVRPKEPTPALTIRVECASDVASLLARLQRAVADAFRERLGVAADVEMLARGALPRFDYKAARVVSA
jgi:phenylacetate-coenzyme A ligase PaaK-like adenylate-forming protein